MKNLNLVGIGLVAVLLAAILVVLISKPPQQLENGGRKNPPLAPVAPGQTVTQEQIAAQKQELKPAPAAVDNTRVQATYEKGKTYVNLANVSVTSKGSYKDWGVKTDSTFNYVSEFQISRLITKNDGNIIEMDVRIDRACSLSLFSSIDGIKFDLPPLFHAVLEPISMLNGFPPGSSEITLAMVEKGLNADTSSDYVNQIAQDKLAKQFSRVETLEGKKAHVIFENGRGVVSITPIGCSLDGDEQMFFETMSACADISMMKDLNCKVGDTWKISGNELMPILDPSFKGTTGGSITVVRGKDINDANGQQALVEIKSGLITIEDYADGYKSKGRWGPTGSLIFSFDQKIFTEAVMGGALSLVKNSTDHILFEMKNVIAPTYNVKCSAWIEQGDSQKAMPTIKPPMKEGSLERLKSRLPVPVP